MSKVVVDLALQLAFVVLFPHLLGGLLLSDNGNHTLLLLRSDGFLPVPPSGCRQLVLAVCSCSSHRLKRFFFEPPGLHSPQERQPSLVVPVNGCACAQAPQLHGGSGIEVLKESGEPGRRHELSLQRHVVCGCLPVPPRKLPSVALVYRAGVYVSGGGPKFCEVFSPAVALDFGRLLFEVASQGTYWRSVSKAACGNLHPEVSPNADEFSSVPTWSIGVQPRGRSIVSSNVILLLSRDEKVREQNRPSAETSCDEVRPDEPAPDSGCDLWKSVAILARMGPSEVGLKSD